METIDAFATAYPLHILIADEQAAGRAATHELLAGLGYDPDLASTSGDLFRLMSAQKYDLILMDIDMPGLDRLLDNQVPAMESRPLIIAITDAVRLCFREACRQALVDLCMERPTKPSDLQLQLKACSVLAGKCRTRFRA